MKTIDEIYQEMLSRFGERTGRAEGRSRPSWPSRLPSRGRKGRAPRRAVSRKRTRASTSWRGVRPAHRPAGLAG
mgnify:CR=1 FL=1